MFRFTLLSFALLASVAASAQQQGVTIYNQGASVVTEARSISLQKGVQDIQWSALPDQLLPQTLLLQGQGVELLGSRYLGDTLNAQAVLKRRQGQNITLLRDDGQGGDITRTAQLVSASQPVLVKVDGRIEVLDANSPWRIAFASLPPALTATPALNLRVKAESGGTTPLRLTYQVNGLGWSGEYVGRYDDDAQTLRLHGQAVLRNNSGGDFVDAKVDLIAGDIARAGGGRPYPVMARAQAFKSDAAPEAAPAFEYYRYDLPGKLTLANGETRNVSLFKSQSFPVKREYRIENGWRSVGDKSIAHAQIRIGFNNTLNKPLPAGTVRVYDASASPLLLGEDHIGHTAKKQPVSLTLGRAFDISAERIMVDQTRDGQTRTWQRRIVVSNAKDRAVKVKVVESLPGDWKILSESLTHTKIDANRVAWIVGVPKGGKAVLNYRMQYR